ncbi:MAG: non-canonical purine NTP pyrophosphatase [Candidatus Diapherotrites archaeon]
MRTIFIATENKHKVREIGEILARCGVKLEQKKIKISEPHEGSLEMVACEKARQAYEQLKEPVIAEDTGIYFGAYKDFPGVMAKRVYLQLGFKGLVALVKAAEDKNAEFRTAICFKWGAGKEEQKCFSGSCKGRLLDKVVLPEKDRLPYEKIFVPEGYEKAMVEIPVGEKNRISHRAKAAVALGKWLQANPKSQAL